MAQAAGEEASAPVPQPRYAPDRQVDVLRIAVDVTPNFAQRTIAAQAELTFAPLAEPVRALRLDAVGLRIESVTGSSAIKEFDATDRKLTILFREPIEPGAVTTVTVKYTAEPKRGLYFRTPELGYPAGDTHLFTQGEAHEAPHWFPCFDYPNERSATEVTCRVPAEMTVLSNGEQVSDAVDPDSGLRVVHWKQDKPHVNYLVCLVAGRLHKVEGEARGVPLRLFTQPSLAPHAANAFRDTAKILEFYEDEIGVPFPWKKYDQATCLDFVAGGMENTTLTTLTDRTVFADATENIRTSRGLDAHEFAHQWFGDYVTCKDWSHLWLNEGFATYYALLYEGHSQGRDAMLYGLLQDADEVFAKRDDPRPIVFRAYRAAMDQFDFRAYPKGSWVLHMLRRQLGEETYRKAVRVYLQKHALSSVVTQDLLEEMELASGESLDRFFDQWTQRGGFPSLKVTHAWLPEQKLAHVKVQQSQADGAPDRAFHLPTTLRFWCGEETIDHEIEITTAEQDFYVPLPQKPERFRFDPEYTLLAEVDADIPQPMLEAQLAAQGDVIGRVLSARALGKKENAASVAALAKALKEDPFFGVRAEASRALQKLHTDSAYEALVAGLRQDDARARLAVVESLAGFYRPDAAERLTRVVETEQNPAIVAAAVRGLGKFGAPRAATPILAALEKDSFRGEIAAAAIAALGELRDPTLADRMIAELRNRRAVLTDLDYGLGLEALARALRGAGATHAKSFEAGRALIEGALADPAAKLQISAANALGELGDVRSIPLLRTLTEIENDRLAASAGEAIKKLEANAPLAPEELKQLRQSVRELEEQTGKLREELDRISKQSEAKQAEPQVAQPQVAQPSP